MTTQPMATMNRMRLTSEFGSSSAFLVESAAPSRRAFAGSWQQVSVGGGVLIASGIGAIITSTLSDNALEALQDRLACLLGQHGQISLGKTLDSALALGIEVETISRLYVQALTLGEPPVLSDEEMARVLQQMKQMSYGQAPDLEGVNDVARAKA